MSPTGTMMTRARFVARDATADISEISTQLTSSDPIEALVVRSRTLVSQAVDGLQVAACLEADGMTDRRAKVEYGFADVFALAEEVFRRLDPPSSRGTRHTPLSLDTTVRTVGHGGMYLLPAAVFPAVLAALGPQTLAAGVVVIGVLGWVCAGVTAWIAYQLLGIRRPESAALMLRLATIGAVPLAAAVSTALVLSYGGSYGLIGLAIGQMAFQMAANTLMFYRHEGLAFLAMQPAVVASLCYLVAGSKLLWISVALAAISVAVTFGMALSKTFGHGEVEVPIRDSLRFRRGPFVAVIVFTVLSAAYFFQAQIRFLPDQADVALAILPLIAGMGVVEWRALRFGERTKAVLARTHTTRAFAVRMWLLLLGGVAACLATVAVLSAILLALLASADRLSADGVVMAAAGVLLAGVYFLGFILASQERYGWLCVSLLVGLGTYLGLRHLMTGDPLANSAAFLGSTAVLLTLYLTAMVGRLGQARIHR